MTDDLELRLLRARQALAAKAAQSPSSGSVAPPPMQEFASSVSGGDFIDPSMGDGTSLRAMPSGSRFSGRDVIDELDTRFGQLARARASLPPDISTQIKRLSEASGIPESRFGVIDGNIVYSDERGQIRRVTPSVFGADTSQGFFPWVGETVQRGAQWLASHLGAELPQAAGTIAGTAMGPTPLSIPTAGGVAFVADLARQGLDKALAPNESIMDVGSYDYANAAGHGAMAMIGQGVAAGVNRLVTRNPLGVSTFDRTQAMDPARRAQAAQLEAEARRRGINLSAGQATDLRSLKAQERRLARFDETADQMYEFTRRQRETQVPAAFRAEVAQISPYGGQEAVSKFRAGAEAVVDRALDQRNARAKIIYEQALGRPDRFWNENIEKLMRRPSVERGLAYAKLIAKEEGRDITVPVFENGKLVGREVIPDWRSWDYIKRGIDRVIEENTDQFGRVNAYGRAVVQTKNELLKHLDKANPQYAIARAAYGQSSDAVSAILDGGVGMLNKMDGMDRIALVNRFFSRQNIMPDQVAKARSQFAMAGKLDDWNAGVAAWLSDRLDDAMRVNESGGMGNVPGKLHASIWGDARQQQIVKAALGDPARVQSMERLMQVLQAASRSLPEGSPTATDLPAMTGAQTVSKGLQMVGKVASPGTYLHLGDEIVRGIDALRTPEARIRLANALLSGDYDRQLRRLRMLSPTSERALVLTSQILTAAGITTAGGAMFQPPDQMPAVP